MTPLSTPTYRTKNSMDEKTRTMIIEALQLSLADSIDLTTQAKQAHWNVKGPDFIALHELFDKISTDSKEYGDLIAERIVQFGGVAEGTIKICSERSRLPQYPIDISNGKQHVGALAATLAAYGGLVRKMAESATEVHDNDTADILTEISRGVDKYLWFVEAHLQAEC